MTVRSTTWANGTATAVANVNDVAAAVPVTLAASPRTVLPSETFTLTATATPNRAAGTVTAFEWDFNNDDKVDRTTATNSTTHSYPAIGNQTIKVTVKTTSGTNGTATETVSVGAPLLNVTLGAAPVTIASGASVTLTATVTSSGALPGVLTYEWDYNNDGTADEITTGGASATVTHTYNGAPGSRTAKVTVKSADGRSASNTVAITVT